MVWIMAIIGTFVLWKVSGFLADHPPKKIELPDSEPVWEWQPPQETAEERYHKLLAKIDRLPLTKGERRVMKTAARERYIAESMR